MTRASAAPSNHAQPSDPVRAAAAIITIATTPDPPLRVQLGADCLDRVQTKLAQVSAELGQWRSLALSTGYDDACR